MPNSHTTQILETAEQGPNGDDSLSENAWNFCNNNGLTESK